MKKIISVLTLIVSIFIISGCSLSDDNKKTIIATNFPAYDFAREITKGSDIEVKMLLKPGSESHDYEPTPKDIISISKSSMFISAVVMHLLLVIGLYYGTYTARQDIKEYVYQLKPIRVNIIDLSTIKKEIFIKAFNNKPTTAIIKYNTLFK